jgi:hypothetical protein
VLPTHSTLFSDLFQLERRATSSSGSAHFPLPHISVRCTGHRPPALQATDIFPHLLLTVPEVIGYRTPLSLLLCRPVAPGRGGTVQSLQRAGLYVCTDAFDIIFRASPAGDVCNGTPVSARGKPPQANPHALAHASYQIASSGPRRFTSLGS